MLTIVAPLLFTFALVVAVLTVAFTLAEGWDRILEVMSGTRASHLPQLRAARARVAVTSRPVAVRTMLRAAA